MPQKERLGILLRRRREQYTPNRPTFHNINLEFLDYIAIVGNPSQKRPEAGDIFIASPHIEQLVSGGKLELGEKLGEAHYFIENHSHGNRPVKKIHQSRFEVFAALEEKNLLPKIRQELAKVVNAAIATKLRQMFPKYKVAFSKRHLSIEEFQKEAIESARKTIKEKRPNLLRKRTRKR